jgi:hypothetical protein
MRAFSIPPQARTYPPPLTVSRLPPGRRHLKAFDARLARAGHDARHGRVQAHRDPAGALQLRPILLAEPGRGAVLQHLGDEVRPAERDGNIGVRHAPARQPVVVWAQLQDVVGTAIERVELGAAERPSAFEVDRLMRQAPAAPMVRGPAEEALPANVQARIRPAHGLARVQVVRGLVKVVRTTLQQQDMEVGGGEVPGDGHAGRARADDAHIRLEPRRVRQGGGVDQHRTGALA